MGRAYFITRKLSDTRKDAMLHIPGYESHEVYKADQVCKQADERASFRRNPDTGQYCVYMQMPRGSNPPEIPVTGFDYVPTPEYLREWLWRNDATRQGNNIRERMNKHNAKLKEDNWHKGTDDITEEMAEVFAHKIEKAGEAPYFVSRRKLGKKHKS